MNNKTLFIGCDVSTTENYVCGILSDNSKVFSTSFENNIEGAEKMIATIIDTMVKNQLEDIFFAVESTSNYHFHILNFMAWIVNTFLNCFFSAYFPVYYRT